MSKNAYTIKVHNVKDFEIELNDQDAELLKHALLPELQEELALARSIQDEVIKQNETLTKQLDLATKYIQYDADTTSHITRSSMAKGTLAEIKRLEDNNANPI